ncbi:uncharacterized protein M421DRAFT_422455 [Didymella exigua CBS 183.55]|uniref:Uncharacterized protein n=1 Tax=Didymella exigua CBS 183.55 TaxID=1150837 RepID=A0A6A5RH40_9PLEO|nr:uncharacterized protein M421DRAFT_422455 [Didymella exigua CBS 183.55]KAF1926849.1 hypothetical protein M421DRAFT_422455 [Didymella exigua CBS 183.55]
MSPPTYYLASVIVASFMTFVRCYFASLGLRRLSGCTIGILFSKQPWGAATRTDREDVFRHEMAV